MRAKLPILIGSAMLIWTAAAEPARAAEPKPRIVVLTDIAPNNIEPDDMESMIRLMAHADLFEIEALVATTGWSNTGGQEHLDLINKAIDAYAKDVPNLMKRSGQTGFLDDESKQEIGYWPSPDYLRSRAMLGSTRMGIKFIGADNDSAGSREIIKLADESDTRPLWITVWGGANTAAQAVWRVQHDRSPEQLKAFLHKIRIYTITDQDRPWGNPEKPFDISSHQWLRRDFADDLMFIWDECAWKFQNATGVANWDAYAANIQGKGNLGALYPKYKWGVEGDTPSYLYVMPVGLSDPEDPTQGGWGGTFARQISRDTTTTAWTNYEGTPTFDISTKYQKHFYPAIFNNFVARMDWAKDGKGNRNPHVSINGNDGLEIVKLAPNAGGGIDVDASASSDPDGDKLSYDWWILPEAGTYKGTVKLENANSSKVTVTIPPDADGKTIHLICEVTDNGTPPLTSYRRVILTTQSARLGGKQ